MENENYTNQLLEILAKRGITIMYRDSDGYMKQFSKEQLKDLITNPLNMNMEHVGNKLEDIKQLIAYLFRAGKIVTGGTISIGGNGIWDQYTTITGSEYAFDTKIDTYALVDVNVSGEESEGIIKSPSNITKGKKIYVERTNYLNPIIIEPPVPPPQNQIHTQINIDFTEVQYAATIMVLGKFGVSDCNGDWCNCHHWSPNPPHTEISMVVHTLDAGDMTMSFSGYIIHNLLASLGKMHQITGITLNIMKYAYDDCTKSAINAVVLSGINQEVVVVDNDGNAIDIATNGSIQGDANSSSLVADGFVEFHGNTDIQTPPISYGSSSNFKYFSNGSIGSANPEKYVMFTGESGDYIYVVLKDKPIITDEIVFELSLQKIPNYNPSSVQLVTELPYNVCIVYSDGTMTCYDSFVRTKEIINPSENEVPIFANFKVRDDKKIVGFKFTLTDNYHSANKCLAIHNILYRGSLIRELEKNDIEKMVEEGKEFVGTYLVEDIADGDSVYLVLDTDGKKTFIEGIDVNAEGDFLFEVFTGTEYDAGTEYINMHSKNFEVNIVPNLKVYTNPNITDEGNVIEQVYITGTQNRIYPQRIFANRILITEKLLVKLTNTSGSNIKYLSLVFNVHENHVGEIIGSTSGGV